MGDLNDRGDLQLTSFNKNLNHRYDKRLNNL